MMGPARVRLRRLALISWLPFLALIAACSSSGGAGTDGAVAPPSTGEGESGSVRTTSVDESAAPIDQILAISDVDAIIEARARVFSRQVALLIGDLSDPELERLVPAVQAGFDPDLLHRDIAAFMEAEALPGRVEEVAAWLGHGASADARRIVDEYEPPLSLEEWLGEYTTEPPSAVRVRLVARWTEARGTGDFFVLLEQALTEAAYAVRNQMRPGADPFRPLRGDALMARLENSFNAAVVTALHATETVPDSVLNSASDEMESESGQWYVQIYQLAVAEAMRSAGARVVDELAS